MECQSKKHWIYPDINGDETKHCHVGIDDALPLEFRYINDDDFEFCGTYKSAKCNDLTYDIFKLCYTININIYLKIE